MIIKTVLDVGGYETRACPNGRLALEVFSSFKPDIVVSDINMPLLDGDPPEAVDLAVWFD